MVGSFDTHHRPPGRKAHSREGNAHTKGRAHTEAGSHHHPPLNPHSRRGLHTRTDTFTKLTSDTGCMEIIGAQFNETAHKVTEWDVHTSRSAAVRLVSDAHEHILGSPLQQSRRAAVQAKQKSIPHSHSQQQAGSQYCSIQKPQRYKQKSEKIEHRNTTEYGGTQYKIII